MGDLPLPTTSSVLLGEAPASPAGSPATKSDENLALLDVLREAVAVGTRSTDSILESIAEAAGVLSGANGIAIALRQNGVIICRARSGDMAPELGSPLSQDSGISGECLRAAAILVCSDTATDKRVDPEVCERLGLKSIVAVPLRGRMGMVGILEAFSTRTGAFEKEPIEALRALGEIAERAYERERRRQEPVAPVKPRNPLMAAIKPDPAQPGSEEISLKRGYWIIGAVAAAVLLVSLVIGLSWRQTGDDIAANASPAPTKSAASGPTQGSSAPASTRVAEANPGTIPIRESRRESSNNLLRKAAQISPDTTQPNSSGAISSSETVDTPASSPGPAPSITKTDSSDDAAPSVDLASENAAENLPAIGTSSAAMPTFGGTVSQGFTPAVLVKKVEPDYPAPARNKKIAGPVTLEATVGDNGNVRAISAVSGPAELTDAATTAVRQWKYRAAVLNGKPVETQKQITIVFKLP